MEDKFDDSENKHIKFSEDVPKSDISSKEETEDSRHVFFETVELPSKTEVIKPKDDSNKTPRQSSPKKMVDIQLEPYLGETLAKARAKADELEDKLQTLRGDFKVKLQSIDRVKHELKNKETHLMQSVQNIEGYMRQIYSLKRDSDDVFKKLRSSAIQQALDFSILHKEYDCIYGKRSAVITFLRHYRPAQSCLRKAIRDLDKYNSVKELVEYYLVLKLLQKDLLEVNKKRLLEDQRSSEEEKRIGYKARNLPLLIMGTEETIYKIKSEIKEIRLKNTELEQKVNNLQSGNVKEDLIWHDIKRWSDKTCGSTYAVIPPDLSDPRDDLVGQLQKLQDFVVKGNKIVERLHKRNVRV